MRASEVWLVAALRGAGCGLGVSDVDDLVRSLVRLPVAELSEEAATAAYDAASRAARRRDLRADHSAELRRLATRLAKQVEWFNTPRPNGRQQAARSRGRWGDDD